MGRPRAATSWLRYEVSTIQLRCCVPDNHPSPYGPAAAAQIPMCWCLVSDAWHWSFSVEERRYAFDSPRSSEKRGDLGNGCPCVARAGRAAAIFHAAFLPPAEPQSHL